jgi:hypothetical protein
MKLREYFSEAMVPNADDRLANELVRKKNIIRDKIKEAEKLGNEDEVKSLRKELQSLQYQHNKLKVQ